MTLLDAPRRRTRARALRVVSTGFVGGVVASVLGVGVHTLVEGEQFEVNTVRIVGAEHASHVQLRHLADVRSGTHLFTLDLDQVAEDVTRHPWVKSATAQRLLPGTVVIDVTEHEPLFLLALSELWYVDVDGVPFRRARSGDLDYPVLTGLDPALTEARPDLAQAVIQGAIRVLDATAGRTVMPTDDISEIHHDIHHGYSVVMRGGTRVVLGIEDPAARLDRLEQLVERGLDLGAPQHIDLDVSTVAIATPLPRLGS